jgi:hypothetical protein
MECDRNNCVAILGISIIGIAPKKMCQAICNGNPINVVRYFDHDCPDAPEGVDVMEWIKEHAIKRDPKQHKPCSGCGKVANIMEGIGKLTWHRIIGDGKTQWVKDRLEVCSKCEHRTFLSVADWAITGGVEFIKRKLNWSKGKTLPIDHEPGPWKALWCSKCLCCIEAKVLVKSEQCSIEKWDALDQLAADARVAGIPAELTQDNPAVKEPLTGN